MVTDGMTKYEKVKFYYQNGFWTLKMTRNAVVKKWITAEQFKEITGHDYEETTNTKPAAETEEKS